MANEVVNVIDASQTAALLQSRLDRNSLLGFIEAVGSEALLAHDTLSTALQNAVTTLTNEMAIVRKMAQVFDKPETEALEEAFTQFLSTSGVNDLLGSMSISLGGSSYSIASVINAIASADQVVSEEVVTEDPEGLPNRIRMTMQDGVTATLDAVRTDSPDGTTTMVFSGTWRAMPAGMSITFKRNEVTKVVFGKNKLVTWYNKALTSNIVFDLTSSLAPAAAITSAAPDLDGDGVVGTPAAGG